MATPSRKRHLSNCMTVTFTMQPSFCTAIDELVRLDSRGSRASLIESALRQVARSHGVTLPRRLAPPSRRKQ